MFKNIIILFSISLLVACGEDEAADPLVTFNGHVYVYDIDDVDPSSDWVGLPNRKVSIYLDQFVIVFPAELITETESDNDGFYETQVRASEAGLSFEENVVRREGFHRIDADVDNFSVPIKKIAQQSAGSPRFVQTQDVYYGREARLLVSSDWMLDSAYVSIKNSNEFFSVDRLFDFYNIEHHVRGYYLGDDEYVDLPSDPDPVYQVEVTIFEDGEMTTEAYEITLNPENTTRIMIE